MIHQALKINVDCILWLIFYISSIKNDIPLEATLALKLLDATTSFSEESRAHFQKCIPKEIIHLLQTITEK